MNGVSGGMPLLSPPTRWDLFLARHFQVIIIMSSTPVLSTDEDIESVPSCNPDSLQNSSDSLWDMHGGERRLIY